MTLILVTQSNLSTKTALVTPKLWSLLRGCHCSKLLLYYKVKKTGPQNSGRCRQLVTIRSCSWAQLWLYLEWRTKTMALPDELWPWRRPTSCRWPRRRRCRPWWSSVKARGFAEQIRIKFGSNVIMFIESIFGWASNISNFKFELYINKKIMR